MKFKARYTIECEIGLSATDVQAAERAMREHLSTIHGDTLRSTRLLGVIRADLPWEDAVSESSRPPRNTPPSGSPGTPTARLDEQPVPAVAVAA